MSGNSSLVEQASNYIMTVDMFPVFFLGHFVIACRIVREDSKQFEPQFRQKHPFASWFCTVMTGLSGVFVANFLFGDPLVDIMKENQLIITLTVVWYLVNYSPFDLVYKVVSHPAIALPCACLQEALRVRFIYLGLLQAANIYPRAHIIILLGGIIKGNGYGFIKMIERLARGVWTPSTNELLDVTYFTKSGVYSSIVFFLHHIKVISAPINLVYSCVVLVFVCLRVLVTLGGITDPLSILDAPVCHFLFGKVDEVTSPRKGKTEDVTSPRADKRNEKKKSNPIDKKRD